MKSSCVPVFPPCPPSPPGRKASLNHISIIDDSGDISPRLSYTERLAQRYEQLASLPFELEPPSRPSSPTFASRSLQLQEKIVHAVLATGPDTSSPKWGHVNKLVRMSATSRRRGAASGVRVGERVEVDVGDYEFVMPDTEAGWEECERRWATRRLTSTKAVSGKGKEQAREARSKYWPNGTDKLSAHGSDVLLSEARTKETKEDRVKNMVRSWQAAVVYDEPPEVRVEELTDEATISKKKQRVKTKLQSPLEFPVAKLSTASSSNKPGQGSNNPEPAAVEPAGSPMDVQMLSPERPQTPTKQHPDPIEASSPIGIADVSEASFLPPSFPGHLETSTPHDTARPKPNAVYEKQKPAPIYARPFFSSSPPSPPLSNPSPFNPARPWVKLAAPLAMSSSLPIISPTSKVAVNGDNSRRLKRTRPLTPPDDDVFITGVAKKPRRQSPTPPPQRQPESSVPPPPSTPPSMTTPPLSKSRTPPQPPPMARTGSGLGNAKGLPVLETPERKDLPWLADLLASSRKSIPRPRPPSRKLQSPLNSTHIDETHSESAVEEELAQKDVDILPAVEEPVPDVSPAKTYFSSPASGSSQSTPQHLRRRPRSPVSPLFNTGSVGNISRFIPPFTSTQQQHLHHGPHPSSIFKRGFGGDSQMSQQTQGTQVLARGSSGLFGMYNSQFDVEAQVGQVSELLERDVDFNEYLKDVDELEEEEEEGQQGSLRDKNKAGEGQKFVV